MPAFVLPAKEIYDLSSHLRPPRMIPIVMAAVPDHWREFCGDYKIQPIQVTAYENAVDNQKIWAACGVLARGIEKGHHVGKKKIGDSSSGNYIKAVAWAVRKIRERWPDFSIEGVVAVIPHSTPKEKREDLESYGIELRLADNSLAAMELAAELAEKEDWWYTRQYWNLSNAHAWIPFAESVAEQLPSLGAYALGVGTGGSAAGIMGVLTQVYSRRRAPMRFRRIAVEVEEDEVDHMPHAVDGVRGRKALKPGTLPWRGRVDSIRMVAEDRSRISSAGLWRQEWYVPGSNCIGGYSTGFSFEGLMLGLLELAEMCVLGDYANEEGVIEAAFQSADTRKPYRTKYARHGIHFQ